MNEKEPGVEAMPEVIQEEPKKKYRVEVRSVRCPTAISGFLNRNYSCKAIAKQINCMLGEKRSHSL